MGVRPSIRAYNSALLLVAGLSSGAASVAPSKPPMKHLTRPLLALAGALTLAVAAPGTALAQDAAAGQTKAAMCIGCHGIPGYQASFPEVYKVPKISGQNAKYIVAALNAYKKGERKHPTMRSVAASLTDADMADLAAFYETHGASSVKTVAASAAAQPPAEVGALLAKGACASCHGADFNKPIDGAYPKLAGQHADFLYAALRAYSVEGNPQLGRANAIMGGQVKQFKRSELKALADYLATLPGDVRTVRQSPFK
jgi:cytochrome c553